MELRKGSKQTEVGVIPNDWQLNRIKDVCSMKSGKGITAENISELDEYPCYGGGGLRGYTNTFTHSGRYTLVGRQGALCGNVSFVNGDFFASEHSIVVTPNSSTDILWLGYSIFRMNLNQYTESSAQPGLSVMKVLELPILTPPTKSEQTAIANALSDADALIGSLEKLIEKKRNIKQGAMQELLKPKKGWVEMSILQIADNKKELFDDGDWIEYEHITTEGIRLIQTGNIGLGSYLEKDTKKYINEASFKSIRCKELKIGDLLICRLAEPAGRACILPDIGEYKVVTSVDVTIFRPREEVVNRIFLMNVFSTNKWLEAISGMSGGTTHKRISRGALGRTKICIPSIAEQNRIAEILNDMDNEIASLEKKLFKSKMLKQGMMQELLTGKIRLI